jgi:hypothetical protein
VQRSQCRHWCAQSCIKALRRRLHEASPTSSRDSPSPRSVQPL